METFVLVYFTMNMITKYILKVYFVIQTYSIIMSYLVLKCQKKLYFFNIIDRYIERFPLFFSEFVNYLFINGIVVVYIIYTKYVCLGFSSSAKH